MIKAMVRIEINAMTEGTCAGNCGKNKKQMTSLLEQIYTQNSKPRLW